MSKQQSERIASIIRLRKDGRSYVEIAKQFGITPVRARQIFEGFRRDERQRAELVEKYGARPKIATLPDSTPLEVLTLCDGKMYGWAARLTHRTNSPENPIKTLGDLRNMTDAQLLAKPSIGKKMAAELRWFCPSRDAPKERRHIASTRRAAAHVLEHMRRAIRAIEELEGDAANADGAPAHSPSPSLKEAREELEKALALVEQIEAAAKMMRVAAPLNQLDKSGWTCLRARL